MKKILGLAIISIILLALGSTYVYGQRWGLEKVVLQQDVRAETLREGQLDIRVERLDLKLGVGEYFNPGFYIGDEVFGDVGIDYNIIQSTEKFPVGGILKDHLYQLKKDNTIEQTTKKVFSNVYGPQVFGYGLHNQEGKVYSIDYTREEEPREMAELEKAIRTVEFSKDNLFISEIKINENKTYLKIMTIIPDKGSLLYFYDSENNKIYKGKENIPNKSDVVYIDALKSLVRIDKDLKCFKVVFDEDGYHYDEYMDLKPYLEASDAIGADERINYIPLNDEEILITALRYFRRDGYFSYHPVMETKSLGIFNFKTNQFQELFAAQEKQHVNVDYVGDVKTVGGYLIILDEFEDDEGFISPKERRFMVIKDGQLSLIFNENIQDEGNTLSPVIHTVVREDGKEIFLMRSLTVLEDNIEATKGAVYKRYIIE